MKIEFKIKSGIYQIRSFKETDIDSLVKYANNHNVSKNLRDRFPYPYTKEDGEEWLKIVINRKPELIFAISGEQEVIGGIGLDPKDDVNRFSVEIGYWLGEPFWGKGIAAEAVKILTEYVFSRFSFNRIYADVFEGNTASEKVLIKAGYKLEGTLRKSVYKEKKFLDQHIYSILKDELK